VSELSTPDIKEFSVVIASPRDMKSYRELVKAAIDNVNQILQSMQKPYRLKAVDQSQIEPGAGNPQKHAQRKLAIRQSKILVVLFGARIGSPPGKVYEGEPAHQSGTVAEIHEAFDARKNNHDLQPEIMVYHKTDMRPDLEDLEELRQYVDLKDFLNEFNPDGKYPVFFIPFERDEINKRIQNDLLGVCTRYEEKWLAHDRTGKYIEPAANWYQQAGLKGNPFLVSFTSSLFLEEYYTAFYGLTSDGIKNLFAITDPVYIFGDRGTGKTTLVDYLMANEPLMRDEFAQRKSFRVGAHDFDRAFEEHRIGVSQFSTLRFSQILVAAAERNTRRTCQRPLPALPKSDMPFQLLDDLMRWLLEANHARKAFFWIDELDEISLVKSHRDPESALFEMLEKMLAQPRVDGLRVRYLLPSNMERRMKAHENLFRIQRYLCIHLRWNAEKLQELISQRLAAASVDRGTYERVAQLCDRGPQGETIDDEIIELAQHNPRRLVQMASRLFELHTSQGRVPEQITWSTWEEVKQEFTEPVQDEIIFPAHEGFWIDHEGTPHFEDHHFELPEIERKILCCLIAKKGEICGFEAIKQAGWVTQGAEAWRYVSQETLYENTRLLKKEIQKIAPGWLQNVRGRGYILRRPKDDQPGDLGGK
jgi:hypothetical protein